jgi:hypothetical protein
VLGRAALIKAPPLGSVHPPRRPHCAGTHPVQGKEYHRGSQIDRPFVACAWEAPTNPSGRNGGGERALRAVCHLYAGHILSGADPLLSVLAVQLWRREDVGRQGARRAAGRAGAALPPAAVPGVAAQRLREAAATRRPAACLAINAWCQPGPRSCSPAIGSVPPMCCCAGSSPRPAPGAPCQRPMAAPPPPGQEEGRVMAEAGGQAPHKRQAPPWRGRPLRQGDRRDPPASPALIARPCPRHPDPPAAALVTPQATCFCCWLGRSGSCCCSTCSRARASPRRLTPLTSWASTAARRRRKSKRRTASCRCNTTQIRCGASGGASAEVAARAQPSQRWAGRASLGGCQVAGRRTQGPAAGPATLPQGRARHAHDGGGLHLAPVEPPPADRGQGASGVGPHSTAAAAAALLVVGADRLRPWWEQAAVGGGAGSRRRLLACRRMAAPTPKGNGSRRPLPPPPAPRRTPTPKRPPTLLPTSARRTPRLRMRCEGWAGRRAGAGSGACEPRSRAHAGLSRACSRAGGALPWRWQWRRAAPRRRDGRGALHRPDRT